MSDKIIDDQEVINECLDIARRIRVDGKQPIEAYYSIMDLISRFKSLKESKAFPDGFKYVNIREVDKALRNYLSDAGELQVQRYNIYKELIGYSASDL